MKILKTILKVILTLVLFIILLQVFRAIGFTVLGYSNIDTHLEFGANIKSVIEIFSFLIALLLSIKIFESKKYLKYTLIGLFSLLVILVLSIVTTNLILENSKDSNSSVEMQSIQKNVPIKLKIIIGKVSDERFILIDTEKNQKIGSVFKEVSSFVEVEGKLISKVKVENDKYGFIDSNGLWIFKPVFDDARTFSKENIARVRIGKKWGFIKPNGKWLVKPKFRYVGAFSNGYAFVKDDNGLFHYINTLGKEAFKGNYSSASNFCKNEQAVVSMKGFYGRINSKGEVVEPFIHVKKNEAMKGCINSNERISVHMYSIGEKNRHWGIKDDDEIIKFFPSNMVSPLDCNELHMFMDEKTTMVDKEGGLAYFDYNAELVYHFSSNKEGTMSLYDAKNKEIWKSDIQQLKVDSCQIYNELEEERDLIILQSSKLTWELPSKKVCISNGGKMKHGVCSANWQDAIKICKENSGRLPTLRELEGLVLGCGGELKDDNKAEKKRNIENSSYQFCYKKKNFTSGIYWSSSFDVDFAHYIWLIEFANGSVCANTKKYRYNIQCVK